MRNLREDTPRRTKAFVSCRNMNPARHPANRGEKPPKRFADRAGQGHAKEHEDRAKPASSVFSPPRSSRPLATSRLNGFNKIGTGVLVDSTGSRAEPERADQGLFIAGFCVSLIGAIRRIGSRENSDAGAPGNEVRTLTSVPCYTRGNTGPDFASGGSHCAYFGRLRVSLGIGGDAR